MMTSTALKMKRIPLVFEIVLATVGGAIGTLITGEFESAEARLIGAILGAAVPALVTALVQRQRPWLATLAAGVGVTAAAVALNYVSFTTANYVNAQPATYPLPQALPPPIKPIDHRGGQGWSGIKVDPTFVKCTVKGCQDRVTITSTGTQPLLLQDIRFDGPTATSFKHDGKCVHKEIPANKKCHINVRFMPSGAHGTQQARLVIHHKMPQGTTFVRLEADAGPLPRPLMIDSITATRGIHKCLVYVVAKVSSPEDLDVHIMGNASYTVGNQSMDTPLTLSPYPAGGPSAYRSNGQITLSGRPDKLPGRPDKLRVSLTATNGIGQKTTRTATILLNNLC